MSERFVEKDAGLEGRYRVEKINDPTGKHDECRYFVLDPQHDPIAAEALRLYAARTPHRALARDLHDWLDGYVTPPAETGGCCVSCEGGGGTESGPCWDCRGTGCAHTDPCVTPPDETGADA